MTGKTLINLCSGQSFEFINFLKNANGIGSSGGYAWPGVMDTNGYPTTAPATAITMTFVIPTENNYPAMRYIFRQRSGTTGTWGRVSITLPSGSFTVNSDANSNVVSNSSNVLTVAGSNPNIDITLNGLSGAANGYTLILTFLTTGGAYTTPDMVFCRSDQASLLASGEIFNPDFVTLMQALNPKIVRLMDWCSVNNTLNSQFAYRAPSAALSYKNERFHPAAWVGAISTSGSNYTCSAPSDWSAISDGACLQGQFGGSLTGTLSVTGAASGTGGVIRLAMASTASLSNGQKIAFTSSGGLTNGGGVWTITVVDATHIELQGSTYASNITGTISVATITVGSNGAKLLRGSQGIPSITNADLSTLVYDVLSDCFFVVPRGLGDSSRNGAMPIEIQVAMANKLGISIWTCLPIHYTDSSITALSNYVRDNLSSSLNCYYELSNEVGNSLNFTNYFYAQTNGIACGFPASRAQYSFHGLRSRMMFALLDTSYSAASKTNYKKVLGNLLYLDDQTSSQTYRWNGRDLAPSGTSTGVGNSTYNSYTGSANYTASPNRPVDLADSISYATYYSGALLNDPFNYASFTTGQCAAMASAADSWLAGDKATAFAWCDSDLQSGTAPGVTTTTLNAVKTKASSWNTLVASYNGSRAVPLTVDCYEGGYSSWGPTTTDCGTIGISTSYGNTMSGNTVTARGTIQLMLDDYKKSFNFYQKSLSQYTDFMSLSNAGTPTWFSLTGVITTILGNFTMCAGSMYHAPSRLGSGFIGDQYHSLDATLNYNNNKRRFKVVAS